MDNAFTDLRISASNGGDTEEGFWPSFTDVMTVIVMIFLMAMLILLIKNMDLVTQLRATMAAEREAAELARNTSVEKETLALRLINTENELSMMRMQLMHLTEQNEQKSQLINKNNRLYQNLSLQLRSLTHDKSTLTAELEKTRSSLQAAATSISSQQRQMTQLESQLESTQSALQQSREENEQQTQRLAQLALESDNRVQQFSQLEDDYSSLKVKYDKLVRPARTPKGKFVVEVRYQRKNKRDIIEYKTPNMSAFQPLNRTQMDKRFSALKNQYQSKLYIKVIFPKDSGLSYNEAWKFTSHLHKNYDYYFQEEPEDLTETDTNTNQTPTTKENP
ncbi:MAG: hypothetical protein KZQ58_05050 [gamma proteobacterium symbiont of Bathyaustriella thionipta]|nr:hypothetical protein [gamma proteobacterium symbiont of Bathyaustriella thionipta]